MKLNLDVVLLDLEHFKKYSGFIFVFMYWS